MARKVKAKRGRTGEVRVWEPGYMDKIKYGLASMFGDDREAVRNAEKIISGAEWLPGAGDALAAAEAKDEWDAGNYGTAGVLGTLAAIGLIPGAGDVVQKGGKKGVKKLQEWAAEGADDYTKTLVDDVKKLDDTTAMELQDEQIDPSKLKKNEGVDEWVAQLQAEEKPTTQWRQVPPRINGNMSREEIEWRGNNIINLLKNNKAHLVNENMLNPGSDVDYANLSAYLYDNYDLPMDEKSRMGRMWDSAETANGPTVDLYHGTVSDIRSFDPAKLGSATEAKSAQQAAWMSDNPEVGEIYARNARPMLKSGAELDKERFELWSKMFTKQNKIFEQNKANFDGDINQLAKANQAAIDADPEIAEWKKQIARIDDLITRGHNTPSGDNLMPLIARGDYNYTDLDGQSYSDLSDMGLTDYLGEARELGKDGIYLDNFDDTPGDYIPAVHLAVDKDKLHQIRSKFARFDPRLRHLRNLNAGVAPFGLMGLMGYGAMNEEDTY